MFNKEQPIDPPEDRFEDEYQAINEVIDNLRNCSLALFYENGNVNKASDIFTYTQSMVKYAEENTPITLYYDEEAESRIDSLCYDFDRLGKVEINGETITELEDLVYSIDSNEFDDVKNSLIRFEENRNAEEEYNDAKDAYNEEQYEDSQL